MFNFPRTSREQCSQCLDKRNIQALIASSRKSSLRRGEKFPILLYKIKKKKRERERRLCVLLTRPFYARGFSSVCTYL